MEELEMMMEKASEVIRSIAASTHCSEDEVRKEMDAAIQAGYENPDPETRAMWKLSPFSDRKPTPEEFLIFCTAIVTDYEERKANDCEAER